MYNFRGAIYADFCRAYKIIGSIRVTIYPLKRYYRSDCDNGDKYYKYNQ